MKQSTRTKQKAKPFADLMEIKTETVAQCGLCLWHHISAYPMSACSEALSHLQNSHPLESSHLSFFTGEF